MAKRFFGRSRELAALRGKFEQPGFQMAVVYGRRRVGKTSIINRFIDSAECKTVSFVSLERDEREQLAMLGDSALSALAPDMLGTVGFDSFERVFSFIANTARGERVILFIDEYPYLAKECRYMNSLLQRFIDNEWRETQLYLVLCGSLVSFMREDVLGESAPLHGRSTLELKVRPMGYRDSAAFVPRYSNEDKAIVYGLTGGVPKYLEQFDDAKSLERNIVDEFYEDSGYFTEEQVQTLVTADRSNPAAFNAIISAVASGHTKYSEIATSSGLGDISYYLKSLVSADILERRVSSGKPYYVLADAMLRFWFNYVSRAASLINAGRGELYYERIVKSRLHEHMGPVFEEMARQFLFENMGTDVFPCFATDITNYQNAFKTDGEVRQVELDLVGTENKRIVFAGECKFRNQRFGKGDMSALLEKVALLPARDPDVVAFSLGGFTDEVRGTKAFLYDIGDLYR